MALAMQRSQTTTTLQSELVIHVGRWLPHPDTVPLLELYLEWCRRTGRHPKIDPVNARGV